MVIIGLTPADGCRCKQDVGHLWEALFGCLNKGVLVVDNECERVCFSNSVARHRLRNAVELRFPTGELDARITSKGTLPTKGNHLQANLTFGTGNSRDAAISVVPLNLNGGEVAVLMFEDMPNLEPEKEFHGMVADSPSMKQLFQIISEVGPLDVPVLIEGETGTGKDMVAAALHAESRRSSKPLVIVNCGALAEGLLESELFGHVKGAFSGAFRDSKGRFELADGGTILLDEIGELTASMQMRLLRVLQDGTFQRVGEGKTCRVNARVLCATNRDLIRDVESGRFRADLYYRLSVFPIAVPALRERPEDIYPLAGHFLRKSALEFSGSLPVVSDEFLQLLRQYAWPGNVRELENCIRYAAIRGRSGVLDASHLPHSIRKQPQALLSPRRPLSTTAVSKALEAAGGNRTRAAELLGVSRATFYRVLSGSAERFA